MMFCLTLIVINTSIGMALILSGVPTIQALYFSAFTTYMLGQSVIYLKELKKANTHTPTKVDE